MLRRLSIIAIVAKINCHKVTGNYEREECQRLAVYGGIAGLSHRSGAEFMMKAASQAEREIPLRSGM